MSDVLKRIPKIVWLIFAVLLVGSVFFPKYLITLPFYPVFLWMNAAMMPNWFVDGSEYFFDLLIRFGILSGFLLYALIPKHGRKLILLWFVIYYAVGMAYWDFIWAQLEHVVYSDALRGQMIVMLFVLPTLFGISIAWLIEWCTKPSKNLRNYYLLTFFCLMALNGLNIITCVNYLVLLHYTILFIVLAATIFLIIYAIGGLKD